VTDTTEQQAVTVAQEARRVALIERIGTIADQACSAPLAGELGDVAYDLLRQAAAQISSDRQHIARLASVSSASAEGQVREAFSGVMRAEVVNGSAWSLHLHFGSGDGSRDRMRAASSLLGSIVTAPPTPSATTSREGEWVTVPREPTQDQLIAGNGMFHTGEVPLNIYRAMLAASPEPVPATNQAGEVDIEKIVSRSADQILNGFSWETLTGPDNLRARLSMAARQAVHDTLAALATQPATSQEGEACPFCTDVAKYTGRPEDIFCEKHLRLYRMAGAA
jgi:hypothetical protein